MGLLRVLLALAVLLGHSGGVGGYAMTGGPVAVQAFFIISGFYMGLVLNERYDRPQLNGVFYLNRLIRIYAMYLFFLVLYLAVFAVAQVQSGASPLARFADPSLDRGDRLLLALLNVTVVGQDLVFWLKQAGGHLAFTAGPLPRTFLFMVIPMAWSMALEIYFYVLAPFVARRPARQILLLFALSFGARTVAAVCGLVEDPLNYRFFPFELALFLAGVLAYKGYAAVPEAWTSTRARLLALLPPAAVMCYPLLPGAHDDAAFFTPARLIVLGTVAFALPAVHGWSCNRKWDRAIGELSYPLYLSHWLVLCVLSGIPALRSSGTVLTLATAAVALGLSWLVVRFVDRPIEALRRRIAAQADGRREKGRDRIMRLA